MGTPGVLVLVSFSGRGEALAVVSWTGNSSRNVLGLCPGCSDTAHTVAVHRPYQGHAGAIPAKCTRLVPKPAPGWCRVGSTAVPGCAGSVPVRLPGVVLERYPEVLKKWFVARCSFSKPLQASTFIACHVSAAPWVWHWLCRVCRAA